MSQTRNLDFPDWAEGLFRPKRYKAPHGGRGSSKSWSVARWLILEAADHFERVLCAREIQKTIKESVHKLLCDQIESLGLLSKFDVTQTSIKGKDHGSEFIFAGLRTNANEIKSLEGVTKCWVEEAEKVSKASWAILIPTIRTPDSEIIVTFNPDLETDPTSQKFLVHPPPDCWAPSVNWQDNPWFPDVLRKEMDYDYAVDPEAAAHVWGGQYRKNTKAQILAGKYVVEAFEPHESWHGPFFGADFGFAQDPATLVKQWMSPELDVLYIEHEAYAVGVGNDQMAALYRTVPGSLLLVKVNGDLVPAPQQHEIRCDCSRPETINHLGTFGFGTVGCKKWPGSVEDGIAWLRGLKKIVIHPRCKHAEEEARLYSYKVDPITGDVLPVIVDKHNHVWDAVRYGMEKVILLTHEHGFSVDAAQIPIAQDLDELDIGSALSW